MASASGLLVGGLAWLLGDSRVADVAWAAGTVPVLLVVAVSILQALRRGEAGVDIIALLAMAGSLALGQYLAGAVIALMFSTGGALEDHARARARRELSALLGRAPEVATATRTGGSCRCRWSRCVPATACSSRRARWSRSMGSWCPPTAVLDESALTGESLPVVVPGGRAGAQWPRQRRPALRAARPRTAAESTYAGIVRLVEAAQTVQGALRPPGGSLRAPLRAASPWSWPSWPGRCRAIRSARSPCWWSPRPVRCILAAPVAIVAGISRAARRGVIVKGGAPWRRSPEPGCCCSTRRAPSPRGRPG